MKFWLQNYKSADADTTWIKPLHSFYMLIKFALESNCHRKVP